MTAAVIKPRFLQLVLQRKNIKKLIQFLHGKIKDNYFFCIHTENLFINSINMRKIIVRPTTNFLFIVHELSCFHYKDKREAEDLKEVF